MPNILARAIFHVAVALFIMATVWLMPATVAMPILSALTLIFLGFEALRFRVPSVNKWFFSCFRLLLRQEERLHLTGATYVILASLATFLLFPREVAVLALGFLAVGDPAAAIIGDYIKGRRVGRKTLGGNLACFVSCFIFGWTLRYAGLDIQLPAILVGSTVATLAQAMPMPVNDNLTIPLLAAVAMYGLAS